LSHENVKEADQKNIRRYDMNYKTKGNWIKKRKVGAFWHFRCSECFTTVAHSTSELPILKFCPNCYKPMNVGDESDVDLR
jgi:hypothetical protein